MKPRKLEPLFGGCHDLYHQVADILNLPALEWIRTSIESPASISNRSTNNSTFGNERVATFLRWLGLKESQAWVIKGVQNLYCYPTNAKNTHLDWSSIRPTSHWFQVEPENSSNCENQFQTRHDGQSVCSSLSWETDAQVSWRKFA